MDVLIIATEEVYGSIPSDLRRKFTRVEFKEENEYQENKEDKMYIQLYKEKKKAKKDLDEYLFRKRHG